MSSTSQSNEKNGDEKKDDLRTSAHILEWKPRFPLSKLAQPGRVSLIVRQRKELASGISTIFGGSGYHRTAPEKVNPAGRARLPANFNGLQSINIGDMNPYICMNSIGNKITLECIEDALVVTRVGLLCQDRVGGVVFVAFYNDEPSTGDPNLQRKVGFGCTITIAEPLLKIAFDGRTVIRVEENPELFIHKEKDVQKCRFCFKGDVQRKCTRCKVAYYCSKECQTQDWKVMKHKIICDYYCK